MEMVGQRGREGRIQRVKGAGQRESPDRVTRWRWERTGEGG